jgi:hypothetical protein
MVRAHGKEGMDVKSGKSITNKTVKHHAQQTMKKWTHFLLVLTYFMELNPS